MPLTDIYVPMYVRFDTDPKIVALAAFGDDAGLCRDLYLAMCRYCRRNLTDGHVPSYEVVRLAFPLGMPRAMQLAMHLASVHLITEVSTGFVVDAYVKRNGTREDVEANSARQRDKALRRWKDRPADADASGNPNGTPSGIPAGNASGYAETETKTTTGTRARAPARTPARTRGTATPPPAADVLAKSRRTGTPADPHEWAAKARAGLPAHESSTTDNLTGADSSVSATTPDDDVTTDHPVPGPGDDAHPPLDDDPEAAAEEFPF